jgi:hypothetical protein
MVEVPDVTLLANPCASMVATVGVDELQFAWNVRLKLELSLKVPVAVNC